MRDLEIVDHGTAAVVTCTGWYVAPGGTHHLRFMRVWLKKDGRWQIVAGTTADADEPGRGSDRG